MIKELVQACFKTEIPTSLRTLLLSFTSNKKVNFDKGTIKKLSKHFLDCCRITIETAKCFLK